MSDTLTTLADVPVLLCSPEGEQLRSEQDAVDLIGEMMYYRVTVVVVPVERLSDDFFQLKTRLAGQMVQKFVNYHSRLVVLGNISAYLAQSTALKAFVLEANRGNDLWFLNSLQELEERLQSKQRV